MIATKPTPRATEDRIRILVVCTWPLGGIRTFLKYNYPRFDRNRFEITILANPTLERAALEADFRDVNIRVIWAEPWLGRNVLFARVRRLMRAGRFDIIHSQGFTAAVHVAVANLFIGRPHVLTMHGILEPKHFQGWSGPLRRLIFARVMRRVTVFHAVSQDMLDHFQRDLPGLKNDHSRAVVIRNGVDAVRFARPEPTARENLRKLLGCPDSTTVFGYFGRFMPEKGFDLLLKAAALLRREYAETPPFRVLAMGSGDYETWAKTSAKELGLDAVILFRPFDANIELFIKGCNAVVMPSRHEAWGLLACESLCAGVPVIASQAMGLREAVRDTPALVFRVDDVPALAGAMRAILIDPTLKAKFRDFQATASERFDVARAAQQLMALFESLVVQK